MEKVNQMTTYCFETHLNTQETCPKNFAQLRNYMSKNKNVKMDDSNRLRCTIRNERIHTVCSYLGIKYWRFN